MPELPKHSGRHLSKAEINELPLIALEAEIRVLDTVQSMKFAVEELKEEPHLGFDTETRPSFKKGEYHPPALVQMATDSRVYLFRISKTRTIAPLIPIFESPTILKTGVAIHEDVKELRKIEDFKPSGFVEITDITTKLNYEIQGLRALTALLLGRRISKAAQVSNWSRARLTSKQIRYAATDAWVSREVYRKALAEISEPSTGTTA